MRLATFASSNGPRAAVVASDNTLVPVSDLVAGGPNDMLGLIEDGPDLLSRLRSAAASASGGTPLRDAHLLAPIPRPRRNVLCVGWNYSEHFDEGRGKRGDNPDPPKIPDHPALFTKQPNAVVGPDAAVWCPSPISEQLDWEVELAVIVGRTGRDIPEQNALDYVFGYTVGNDVSVRDVQRQHGAQWFKGKSFDTSCPLGPWIVTKDEIPDPHALRITVRVNGETKQDSNTKYMVFKLPRLICEFSQGMELEPGDVMLTGTPEGTGYARTPPQFLKVGDVMESEIEKIGVLRNRIEPYPGTSH